jgi:hypothetical protein
MRGRKGMVLEKCGKKWGMKKKIGLCHLNGYKKKIDHFALP